MTALVHGTCVELDGRGLLIRGPSGSGKSDLALRLIERGARLVADDQVALTGDGDLVLASAPPALAGRIEVRGIGILTVPCFTSAPVRLVCDLVAADEVPRLPEPDRTDLLPGRPVARLSLSAFDASTPFKLKLVMANLQVGVK